jgi:hypothetical protein
MAGGMALLRKLFWLAVYVISTLSFVVLFENGTANFSKNLGKQVGEVKKFVSGQISSGKPPAQ